jgi:DNA polymerase-1
LLLVDGTAVMYRAFYAIRELSTSDGRPTNAVFGFIRMLRQMRETWQPTHWAVVFDGGLPEARTTLLTEYKAQRPSTPDDLKAQREPVNTYLDGARVPRLRMEGQEADDVMASLARWAAPDRVLIATGDKDMYQLVDERVQVVPVAGSRAVMDGEAVQAKTGVPPSRIVAWLALVGDSVDNIPGVPGVGPKTAAKLLEAHGSLEALFAGLADVPSEKLRTRLAEHRDTVLRNVDLVRLDCSLDCGVSWDALAMRDPDADALLPLFESLEFGSMARELREPKLL